MPYDLQPILNISKLNRGQIKPGNIDLNNRPVIKNLDGSISTVRSFSTNIDGNEVLLPTISPEGENWSNQQAIQNYLTTGKHLGIFSTPEDATEYALKLHKDQEQMYQTPNPKNKETKQDIGKFQLLNKLYRK
jgi:hypothetical protein